MVHLISLGGAFINPEHVVSVVMTGAGTTIVMTSGQKIFVDDASPKRVAGLIIGES